MLNFLGHRDFLAMGTLNNTKPGVNNSWRSLGQGPWDQCL